MADTEIFIVRHGETEFNRRHRIQGRGINEPLNETGRRQARAAGHLLASEEIDYIFSSSLERSIETAKLIAEELELSVHGSHPELDEMDFGVIEGQAIDEIEDELNLLHTNWCNGNTTFAAEEGESPENVLERASACIDKLLREHQGHTLLLVLHGRLIRILLSHWLEYGLPEMHRIGHQNGAIYHLRLNDKKMEAIYLNHTEHLEV